MGHSTRSAEAFLALLVGHSIEHLLDVRRFPASRRYPHFARDALEHTVTGSGISYTWLEALGGRRAALRESHNTAWRNAAFRGYADYMETPEFAVAFDELTRIAERARTAVMCSEAVWWRCHRALLSDLLKVRGATVLHITDAGPPTGHPYTPAARLDNGTLSYDPGRGEPARLQVESEQPSLL